MRLFFAVTIPDDLRTELTAAVSAIDALGRANRSRPEALHITLRFVGEVPDSRRPDVESAGVAAARGAPVRLSLAGGGVFPNDRDPRAFWAGVAGDVPALTALAAGVESALREAGFPGEDRPFAPHLTLARTPRGGRLGLDAATVFRQALAGFASRPFDAKEIHLFRSHPGPTGPRYESLRAFPLS